MLLVATPILRVVKIWTRVSFDGDELRFLVGGSGSRANLDTVLALILATSLTSRAETLEERKCERKMNRGRERVFESFSIAKARVRGTGQALWAKLSPQKNKAPVSR